MRYQHTQTGYLSIILLTCTILAIITIMAISVFSWVAFVVLIILAICLILFRSLTVTISEKELEIWFGSGIIRKKFSLKTIESCQAVKNPWYYGWGIRLTPHGWLFSVSGFSAVEIKLKSGKKYHIGTNVPAELEAAIIKAINTSTLLS